MNGKTAIITDVRYRMSLALIRELKEAGFYIVAVEHDDSTPALGFESKFTDEEYFLSADNYLNELYALCRMKYQRCDVKPLIFPVGAKSLSMLADNSEMISGIAGFCVPEYSVLELLNDKERLHLLAESLGIPVPCEYSEPYDMVEYPCIVKPVCGEKYGIKASDRYRIVNDTNELHSALDFYKGACRGDCCVVQKYIKGRGYGCSVVARDGKIASLICHERIREYPISGGPSMCCRAVHNKQLEEYVVKLVENLKFSGVAMFEFKESDGIYYLLECNPRVWGSFPLVRAAGSDFCRKWAEVCLKNAGENIEISAPADYREIKMHYLLGDLRAGLEYLKSGKAGLGFGAFFDTLNPAVKGGLLEFKDIKPSLAYLKRALKK